MRLTMVALGTLVAGGATGVHYRMIQVPDQMVQAVRVLGGDPAKPGLLDVHPIRSVYDSVMRQITSQEPDTRLGLRETPLPSPDFTKALHAMGKPVPVMPNGFAKGIGAETNQFNSHMEDVRNFARNPGAWHGAPP